MQPQKGNRYFIFGIMASLLSGVATSAVAQTQSEDRNTSIGDIVVTAQRRSENLQDVPITIQAFNAAMLEKAGIGQADDLPLIIPGMTFGRSAGATVPFIRGIGSVDATAGQESPVTTYVDGVYMQSLYSNNLALKNIERIEVLKGPQGTLFGRNATGGLVHIITKEPSSDPGGEFQFNVGNYETYEVSTYATTGIAENLAVDFAGYARRQEKGYGKNLVTGHDVNYNNETLARVKLKYSGENTSVTLSADYARILDTRGLNRSLTPGARGVDGDLRNGGFYDVEHNVDFSRKTRAYGGSLQVDHEFGDIDLIYIGAFRRDRSALIFDNDVTKLARAAARISYFTRTISQEVRLASSGGNAIDWIVGAYYLDAKAGPVVNVLSGTLATLARIQGQVDTKSYSAFGEVAFKLFGNGRLTLGGRYTYDKRQTSGKVNNAVLPEQHDIWKEPTWRIVYDHHLTNDIMAYASYNRGFKSGNFNLIPANQPSYKPEILDAFEIGTKITGLDGRMRLNLSGFFYKYSDLQVRAVQALSTFTVNAASAKIKGLEGDLTLTLIDGVTLNASAAYVHSRYSSFKNAPDYVPAIPGQRCPGVTAGALPLGGNCLVSVDASGKPLIRSPDFSGNVGVTWVAPVGGGELTTSARLSYRDGFSWDPSGRVPEGANTMVNGSIAYDSADKSWGVGIKGENILGSKYQIYGGSVDVADYYSAGAPATYSVFVNFRF